MVKTTKTGVRPKKYEDRVKTAKTAFDGTSVDIETAQTMILLLGSKEEAVLLKALSTLDKFASKLEQNACILYEEGVITVLISLINHTELYIKRFAIKILSELCLLPQVVEVLVNEELVQPMMKILENSEDLVIQEFSLSVVAELTKTNGGMIQLGQSELIHILPNFLTSSDPDIQKNCLQIISNIVNDPYNYKSLAPNINFNTKVFIDLLMSEYPIIQNLSLDLLNIFTQRQKENSIPQEFQSAGGVTMLMSILKNLEWKDLHGKCLDVIGNIYDDEKIPQKFLKDEVLQLFNYIDIINDPNLRKKTVGVIAKIANTVLGRKMLSEGGHVATLAAMVLEHNVREEICHCMAGLTQDCSALQQMLACDTVSSLIKVLADPICDFYTKTAAVYALYRILQCDPNSCNEVVNSGELEVFNSILKQYNIDIPIRGPIAALSCIKILADDAELRRQIITSNLMTSLLHCFTDFPEDTVPLKVAACETLSTLMSEPQARSLLKALDGLSVIWAAVTKPNNNLQLLTSAATFLHLCGASDNQFTTDLLKLDALNWLISQRSLRGDCPAWEVALETLFNKFLPIKFAFTGRLEMTDVTEDNFYITRMPLSREELNNNKFPLLTEFISKRVCPFKTLYVANFGETDAARGTEITIRKRSTLSKKKGSRQSDLDTLSESTSLSDSGNLSFSDPYLKNYLETLISILNRSGFSCEDMSWKSNAIDSNTVRQKALLIGQFVADQMAGMDSTEKCTIHTLDLHINELKMEMQNNIIPLGCLRVGLYMERALLFKVLADKVGLPSSLVRGSRGRRGWVEMALPILPPEPRPQYPNYLLQPNYVLDLLATPVTMYPMGSYEADVYCGLREKMLY